MFWREGVVHNLASCNERCLYPLLFAIGASDSPLKPEPEPPVAVATLGKLEIVERTPDTPAPVDTAVANEPQPAPAQDEPGSRLPNKE